MADAPSISPAPPSRSSQNFEELRRGAIDEIQRLAAASWTDHNLHDPGITIMEAFCYALTELAMKIDLDVSDLVASGNARFSAEFDPARRILPCAPVTGDDLRSVLLDHHLVGDAWLSIGVSDEIQYFQDPDENSPLTYTAGGARVTPNGLYDALLAFDDLDLNSNSFSAALTVGAVTHTVDFALPHWDEPEAQQFRAGGVSLVGVAMLDPGSEWRALDEPLAYFGSATISFVGPDGPATQDTWILMRITEDVDPAEVDLPGVLAAAKALVESTAPNGLIDRFVNRIAQAQKAVTSVRGSLLDWRNLAEFPVRMAVSRIQEIAVYARIEVAATTGLEELLAHIFFAIDMGLSPPVRFSDFPSFRARRGSVEEAFDGPLLTHGFLLEPEIELLVRNDEVFLSDVHRLILDSRRGASAATSQENPSGRDVVAVTHLSLSNFINNRIVTNKATNCLRLVEVTRYRPRLSLTKSRIVLIRDEVEISYDLARVKARFEELQAEKQTNSRLASFDLDWPVPNGEALPVGDYYPFQNDLPATYGVSESGLPSGASAERRRQAMQLRAYLMLFEQFIADTTEQLANVNRLFSPTRDELDTYFTKPILDLDGMEDLVRRFAGGSWEAFRADPENAYSRALKVAVEDEATALDRRNRMLDHLLARQGEDAVAWGQEVHRWGEKCLLRTTVNLASLPERIRTRRIAVNRRLVGSKAAFLESLPELHALRLQSFGNPAHWIDDLIAVERLGTDFIWRIRRNDVFVMESATPAATEGEARIRAREALRFAGSASFYGALNFGGPNNRRFVLRNGTDAASTVIARGIDGFPNLPAATSASVPIREDLERLRIRESRTALERRVDHLIGIRSLGRRFLLSPVDDFFEFLNSIGPAFTKTWQLRSEPGPSGDVLLAADGSFFDANEADAIELARADIERALDFALDEWNYAIAEITPGSFELDLIDPDGVVIASAPGSFASLSDAESARDQIITTLYHHYSVEGFHLVENLLLRPQAEDDPFLEIPISDTEWLTDPYSQRLTVVLPSGYERDFALEAGPRTPARPHRFRDPELRRHVERVIRQSTPVHILPDIHWVDRKAPGTTDSDRSFDVFEARFFAWLRSVLIAGATDDDIVTARGDLVSSVNAIAGS